MTVQSEERSLRVVGRGKDSVVLGIQPAGDGMSDALSPAIGMGAREADTAGTTQAHLIQSDGSQEAAIRAVGCAPHV